MNLADKTRGERMEISGARHANVAVAVRDRPPPQLPRPPRANVSPTNLTDLEEGMKALANPEKKLDESLPSIITSPSSQSSSSSSSKSLNRSSSSSKSVSSSFERPRSIVRRPSRTVPSHGYISIADEKSDILFKFQRLRDSGVLTNYHREFTMQSDIIDMRAELNRVRTELELSRALEWGRGALVGIASTLEMLSDSVDIIDIELEGYSQHMHSEAMLDKKYDEPLEELYMKYRSRMKTSPEVKLLMAIGYSAISFHVSKLFVRKQQIQQQRKEEERRFAGSPAPPPTQRSAPPTQRPAPPTQRPSMRGPSMRGPRERNAGMPGFTNAPVPSPNDIPIPIDTRRDGAPDPIAFGSPFPDPPSPPSPPNEPVKGNEDGLFEDDDSDRVSDPPSTLTSISSSLESANGGGIRSIVVPARGGRGRGRGGVGGGRGKPTVTRRVFEIE